ncbi:hypothetical protein HY008_03285 [Candidatus Woesebacteria bacterium]|nr:hypothetical protein [Candidatus Woesebacteria bacterium]
MKLTGFKKDEVVAISVILIVISIFTLFNLRAALRRQRDAQRKADVRTLTNILEEYHEEFKLYPERIENLNFSSLPHEPNEREGAKYLYLTNRRRFQVYASLEGADEAEYDARIVARDLNCGTRICNFGLASGQTPLEKSIEEYENEINERFHPN